MCVYRVAVVRCVLGCAGGMWLVECCVGVHGVVHVGVVTRMVTHTQA